MDGSLLQLPAGMAGYLLTDLELFLAAADERTRALEEAIEQARARREAALRTAAAAAETRQQIAAEWIAAQRDADDVRAAADADAQAIIEQAEQVARGIQARSVLQQRVTDTSR